MTAPADMHPYWQDYDSAWNWSSRAWYHISFKHQPTGHKVTFPAIISSFSDTHTPTFGQTHGASMHDPIITLKKTDRRISFTLTVLNGSLEAARHHRQCVNLLIQMLYPTVSVDGNFEGKPFIDIHMETLIQSSKNEALTCVIEGLDYGIKFDDGIINANEGVAVLNRSRKEIYPQSLELNIDAKVVIEIDRSDKLRASPFPENYPSYHSSSSGTGQ